MAYSLYPSRCKYEINIIDIVDNLILVIIKKHLVSSVLKTFAKYCEEY